MPSEDSIKAQIQAALAKKKQQAASSKSESVKAAAPEPKIEIKPISIPHVEMANSSTPAVIPEPPPVPTATTLIFAGQSIRFTTHQHAVYFAVNDVLPLAKTAEWTRKFVDFLNNPKTKKESEDLTKILTFKNEDGSDKTQGATAGNVIKIFHALELHAPGPLGRWLNEVSETHKPSSN